MNPEVVLPITLKPITQDVDLTAHIDNQRVLTFLFPRRVLRNIVGAATRFYDFSHNPSPQHTHDVMFTAFFMKLLQVPSLLERFVQSAYIDDGNPHVVSFIFVLKERRRGSPEPALSAALFVKEVESLLREHGLALGKKSGAGEEADDEGGGGGGRGRGGRGGGRGGRGGGKRKRTDSTPGLCSAYLLIRRPTIPVDHIKQTHPFAENVLAWGELLANTDDLDAALIHVFCSRLAELGHVMAGPPDFDARAAPAAFAGGPSAAASSPPLDGAEGSDTSEGEEEDGGATFRTRTREPLFRYQDGSSERLNITLESFVQPTHPLVARFMRDEVRLHKYLPAGAQDLWEVAVPQVDLVQLHVRYLAHTQLYDTFTLYAQRLRGRRDELEANPKGDLCTLSSFFSENPAARLSDPVAAARLSFDVLTRPDGRLPKATAETMAMFVDMLQKNHQKLPPGSGQPVVLYNNLTYSGNYALHVLEQFEQCGTFYFHVEQFITMMVLDGVLYRPAHEDDDDDQSNVGMCANLLNYGPPGVGKSNASLFFLSAYRYSYLTNTYSSLRSIYSNLPCSDFLNAKASYNDEAPAWIPESGGKRAPQERDMIAHLKERLSSGRMAGERLVRDDSKGVHKTVNFNVDVQHAPMVMNTNAPERSGEAPLLERFILRYFIYGPRAVQHALVMGAPPMAVEVKQGIRREFVIQRILSTIASKLQSDGILSFPCKLVFKSYYDRFLHQMRENPWIDCDPPTAGDRRSSIIENMYGFLVNRQVIHRLFIEPGAKFEGVPFEVDHLLEMEREMATGDMQTAILAIGAYSHSIRSPTEYRVADLLSSLVMTRLTREYAKCAAEAGLDAASREGFAGGPQSAAAWSPTQSKTLEGLLGNGAADEVDRFLGAKWPAVEASFRPLLRSRYIPVVAMQWGAGTPSKWDTCGALAQTLLEGQSGSSNKIMHEHAQKRLHLLTTVSARHGDDQGYTAVYLHMDASQRKTSVLMLASWMEDTTQTFKYSVHSMLARAAKECSFTMPGDYLTLEPFTFARHKEAAHHYSSHKGSVPKMLAYFNIPLHEPGCPARDDAQERKPLQHFHRLSLVGCSCFRKDQKPAQVGVESVHIDPQTAAVTRFKSKTPDARMPPVCLHAKLSYPLDNLENALKLPKVTRGPPRDPVEAELLVQREYVALLQSACGGAAEAAAA